MCEPLRGKKCDFASEDDKDIGIHWFGFTEKSVKSAVKFYKKYKNNPMQLPEDDYNEWLKKLKDVKVPEEEFTSHLEMWLCSYNNWLFDYCFGGVIE